ncbi:hypothetical protein OT109_17570 [Phycisphaeraceae bacterium D3-23]
MHASETIQQWFDHASRSFPGVTTGALIGAMVLGLVLWLLGGKLMKAAMVIAGLLLGLYGGLLLSGFASSAGFVGVLTVGMAIAGALAAALLFRVWMAVSTAMLFAIVVPAAVLVWEGTPSTEIMGRSPADVTQDLQRRLNTGEGTIDEITRDRVQSMIDEGSIQSLSNADGILREQGIEAGKATGEAIKGMVFDNIEAVCAWWQENTTDAQRNVALGMGVGALGGLLLGGLFPKYTAAIQAALVGAVLLFIPGRELIVDHAPEAVGWLPSSPRGGLLALGLITLLGILVQWTLYFRPVDKEPE